MHPQQSLRLATQSFSMLLPGPVAVSACSPLHGSIRRYQHLSSSPGSPTVAVPVTIFASHGRKQQHCIAHSLQGWDISQPRVKQWQLSTQGLSRVLRGRAQQLRRAPRSQADIEADSLEDLDLDGLDSEQLDDLFETYGEVVKEESVPTPAASEVDDDAESLACISAPGLWHFHPTPWGWDELAVALAEVANDVKASEIQVLCVKPLVYWTRFFVIATGFSRPQVDAIGQRMRNMAEERFNRIPHGDLKPNAWTLLDFGDVVVHIFYPKERSFYNLEEFYGNAIPVELPFESQSQVI